MCSSDLVTISAENTGAVPAAAVVNNDSTTSGGYVADARIVKEHRDEIDALKAANSSLNGNLTNSLKYKGDGVRLCMTSGLAGQWKLYTCSRSLSDFTQVVLYCVDENESVRACTTIPVSLFRTMTNLQHVLCTKYNNCDLMASYVNNNNCNLYCSDVLFRAELYGIY